MPETAPSTVLGRRLTRGEILGHVPRLRIAAREPVGDPAEADALDGWDAADPGAALETRLLLILGERAIARERRGAS